MPPGRLCGLFDTMENTTKSICLKTVNVMAISFTITGISLSRTISIYFYSKMSYLNRTPDHQDPPVEPAKLFRVQRIKPVKGNPYWEKHLLKEFGLDGKQSDFTVVKNIPEINARLWKIKHLLKVTPITFPYGEPTENDIKHTLLKENGECIVTKEIGPIAQRVEAMTLFEKDPKRLDTELLKRDARIKWLNPW